METLNDFNWEINLFLKNLIAYQNNVNKANKITISLLNEILVSIDEFKNEVDVCDANDLTNFNKKDEIFFKIDENKFEIRHLITCRLCHLQFALSKKEYINHITSESHNLSIVRYKNEQENLFKSNNGPSLITSTPSSTKTAVAAKPAADVSNGTNHKDVNNKINSVSNSTDRNNNVQQQKSQNQQSRGNNFNNRTPNNHFSNLNAGLSNGPMKTLPGNMRNNNGKNSNINRNTGAIPKNSNSNRNSERNNIQPEKSSQNASTKGNVGNYAVSNLIDLIDFTENRTSTKQNEKNQNVGQLISTPIEIQTVLPPVKLPNVFDEDIFSFIDATVKQPPKPTVTPQQANNSQANSRTASSSTINATAGSSQGADIKNVPPYMLNSLYLAYDKKKQEKRPQQNQRPQINRSGEQPQQQQRRDQQNRNSFAQKRSASGNSISLDSTKLDKLFEDINNQKSIEEIRAASQKFLGNDDSIETQSLIGNDSRGQHQERGSGPRQRSSSTVSLNRNQSQNNRNLGATPRRNLNSNTSGGSQRSLIVKPTIDILREYFSRDLMRILTHTMDEGDQLTNLPAYEVITGNLEDLLKVQFPNVKCHLNGSRMIGIAYNRTPLDIYVDLYDSYNEDKSQRVLMDGIVGTENALKKSADWANVRYFDRSTRYSLSATHQSSELLCHFWFGTGVSVYNTQVIQAMFDAQPVCRQLALCIKSSLAEMPVIQMDFFSDYIITLLVIFYFQNKNLLPSIKELQSECPQIKCGENSVNFKKPQNVTICKDRFLDILVQFYEFYINFPFKQNIISVYEGKQIHYTIRNENEVRLSSSLLRFKRFVNSYPAFWQPEKTMCIQDIFVHKLNVARDIHYADVYRFQVYCKESLEVLRNLSETANY